MEARIKNLPSEIEGGIDSEKIAVRIGEKLRQCFASTGFPETANGLKSVAESLEVAMKDFSGVATAFSNPQGGAVAKLNRSLAQMEERLGSTMQHLNGQLRRLTWSMVGGVAILCLGCLVVGIVLGVLLAHAAH